MKRILTKITLLVAVLVGHIFASIPQATHTYFYEIQQPNTGRKFKLLGTVHPLSFEVLSPAIQQQIKRCKNALSEKGKEEPARYSLKLANCYQQDQLRSLIQPSPYKINRYAQLTPKQRAEFERVVEKFLPYLVQGTDTVKLEDFWSFGLMTLYNHCLTWVGMDAIIDQHVPYVEALDGAWCSQLKAHYPLHSVEGVGLLGTYDDFLNGLEQGYHYGLSPYLHGKIETDYNTPNGKLFLNQPMLRGRNELWIPHILKFFNAYDLDLIFVGADHLFGDYGVLNLLRKKGFHIKRATPDGVFHPFLRGLDAKGKPLYTEIERQRLKNARQKGQAIVASQVKKNKNTLQTLKTRHQAVLTKAKLALQKAKGSKRCVALTKLKNLQQQTKIQLKKMQQNNQKTLQSKRLRAKALLGAVSF